MSPIYEYECLKCGHKFEVIQGFKEKLLKKCPVCGAKVKKLLSKNVGFVFKGDGFYANEK